MAEAGASYRLDRAVDAVTDHVLGPERAEITLVEYGSYACPHCRAANASLAAMRDRFGERVRYVFRHRPISSSELARPAALLVERIPDRERFWDAHIALMTRSATLTQDDLQAVAGEHGVDDADDETARRAAARVDVDVRSSHASGVLFTPTFFINGRRYDGAWDESSLADAMLGSLGHRVRTAALDFASWAPSTGLLLLLATILAVIVTNSALGHGFEAFWETPFGLAYGEGAFLMPLRDWINDGLLTVFFLVVGLEIKREFTVGHLAGRRKAALPVAGAIGGMTVPALLYLAVVGGAGPWAHGWGVPMATDTAFAVALIVMLGARVPVELRIFLTAAAIVDDMGAIVVVAIFYSGHLDVAALALAAAIAGALVLLNRSGVYRVLPYMVLGIGLWAAVHAGGMHATLAGVILALVIPTRPPANLTALMAQADMVIATESKHGEEVLRHGPSLAALRALDAIHDRIESPADRTLRHLEPWSSYAVLPLFAFANAGVVLATGVAEGREGLMLAVAAGLVLGKPLGVLLAAALAVRLGAAEKPAAYSWWQLAGAGALAGIGFTMSLFIAGQAFPAAADFDAAKIAVFGASVASALAGLAILWAAGRRNDASGETGTA